MSKCKGRKTPEKDLRKRRMPICNSESSDKSKYLAILFDIKQGINISNYQKEFYEEYKKKLEDEKNG